MAARQQLQQLRQRGIQARAQQQLATQRSRARQRAAIEQTKQSPSYIETQKNIIETEQKIAALKQSESVIQAGIERLRKRGLSEEASASVEELKAVRDAGKILEKSLPSLKIIRSNISNLLLAGRTKEAKQLAKQSEDIEIADQVNRYIRSRRLAREGELVGIRVGAEREAVIRQIEKSIDKPISKITVEEAQKLTPQQRHSLGIKIITSPVAPPKVVTPTTDKATDLFRRLGVDIKETPSFLQGVPIRTKKDVSIADVGKKIFRSSILLSQAPTTVIGEVTEEAVRVVKEQAPPLFFSTITAASKVTPVIEFAKKVEEKIVPVEIKLGGEIVTKGLDILEGKIVEQVSKLGKTPVLIQAEKVLDTKIEELEQHNRRIEEFNLKVSQGKIFGDKGIAEAERLNKISKELQGDIFRANRIIKTIKGDLRLSPEKIPTVPIARSFFTTIAATPTAIAKIGIGLVTKPTKTIEEVGTGIVQLPVRAISDPFGVAGEVAAITVFGKISKTPFLKKVTKRGKVIPVVEISGSQSNAILIKRTPSGISTWKVKTTTSVRKINPKTGRIQNLKVESEGTIRAFTQEEAIKIYTDQISTAVKTRRGVEGLSPKLTASVDVVASAGEATVSRIINKAGEFTGVGKSKIVNLGKLKFKVTQTGTSVRAIGTMAQPVSRALTEIKGVTLGSVQETLGTLRGRSTLGIGRSLTDVSRELVRVKGTRGVRKPFTRRLPKRGEPPIRIERTDTRALDTSLTRAFVPEEVAVDLDVFKFKPLELKGKPPQIQILKEGTAIVTAAQAEAKAAATVIAQKPIITTVTKITKIPSPVRLPFSPVLIDKISQKISPTPSIQLKSPFDILRDKQEETSVLGVMETGRFGGVDLGFEKAKEEEILITGGTTILKPREGIREIQQPRDILGLTQAITQATAQAITEVTGLTPPITPTTITPTTITPTTIISTITPTKVPIPDLLFGGLLASAIKKVRAAAAYDVYVRRVGKYRKVADDLPLGRALRKGARITKTTLASQFKVELDKKASTRQKDIPFRPDPSIFRNFRIVKGRQVPLPRGPNKYVYIERKRKRLTTFGETRGLVAARGRGIGKMRRFF